jgi:hypothetical protein
VTALLALGGAAHAADALKRGYGASPAVAGDLEVGLGIFRAPGTDLHVFTATGRVSAPISGSLNFEVQTTANTLLGGVSSLTWMDAYGHAWVRSPTSAWGVFAGSEFAGSTINSVGAEAKHYLGNLSVGADTAYLWSPAGHAWEASATADIYLTPNHRIGLAAQYFKGFSATKISSVRLDAEARLGASPWSIWGWATRWDSSGTVAWAALGGFRLYLDAPNSTLQSHGADVPFYYQSIVPFL